MDSFQYLSVHSPVFKALFFGNFAENGKEEIEIKDVIFEVLKLSDFLEIVFSKTCDIH